MQCILGSGSGSTKPGSGSTDPTTRNNSDGTGSPSGRSACDIDPAVLQQYATLYRPSTWQEAAQHFEHLHPLQDVPEGMRRLPGSSGNETGPTSTLTSRLRAQGAMLGACVADAAAMGVHWVYDLQLLVSLQEERCAQVGQEGAICMGQGGVRVRLLGKIAGGRWSFTWRIYPYYCRLLLIPHQQGIEGLEFMDPPRR